MRLARRTLLAGLALPAIARAAFPDRPIRLVVPYGGGGQTDIVSRVTADALTRALGQPVLADNRPGGAGNTAAEAVARAPADGYTLLVATAGTNSGLNALLYKQMGYDWQADFTPVGHFCSTFNVLLVHNSIPGADFTEVAAWIRANPGRFTFASAGVGANTHLIMEDIGAPPRARDGARALSPEHPGDDRPALGPHPRALHGPARGRHGEGPAEPPRRGADHARPPPGMARRAQPSPRPSRASRPAAISASRPPPAPRPRSSPG